MGLRSGSKNVARAVHDCGDTLEEKKQQSACLVLIDMSDLTSEVLRHFFGTSEPGLLQASRAYIRELSPAHPHTHTPSTPTTASPPPPPPPPAGAVPAQGP